MPPELNPRYKLDLVTTLLFERLFAIGVMEIAFTLTCTKQQNSYHGKSKKTRVDKMFNFMDNKLMESVFLLLRELFHQVEKRHKTNTDIHSKIMVWALQLDDHGMGFAVGHWVEWRSFLQSPFQELG